MQITTLIPAYKTQYILELFNCLRLQTYPVGKIIISDDSPDGEFRRTLYSEPYAGLREGLDIEIHEGPRNGGYENFKHLVRLWNGRSELVHIMLDDDVLYPEFYARHITAHVSGDLSCSVSRRWTANNMGMPMVGQPVPQVLRDHANRMVALDDSVLFASTLASCNNWLGEFTNTVFRADCAELVLKPELAGVSYAGLWDLGFFIAASMRRALCHIQDYLGFFRLGPEQNSSKHNSPFMKSAHLGYVALAIGGRRAGRLLDDSLARQSAALLLPVLMQRYASEPDMEPFIPALAQLVQGLPEAEDRFVQVWQAFVEHHKL
jgi:hypothetical protein